MRSHLRTVEKLKKKIECKGKRGKSPKIKCIETLHEGDSVIIHNHSNKVRPVTLLQKVALSTI